MKIGIIGGGFGLKVQAPIIEAHPNMELAAVCTMQRHEFPSKLLEEKRSLNYYKNWKEMLDQERIDLLFVSTIPIYHFEITKYALEKGMNVVCEKPFTSNARESNELIQLSKRVNRKVFIDFEWRYLPTRQKVKELVKTNEIGDILHIEFHISNAQYSTLAKNKRGWVGEKEKYGGMLGALGSHMIDCVRWITDDEIQSINGMVHTHVPDGAGEHRDADDAFFIHGKTSKRITFSIQLISGIHHGIDSHLKIFGNAGTVVLQNDKTVYLGKGNAELKKIEVLQSSKAPNYLSEVAHAYYPAFFPFLENVYEAIVNNKWNRDLPTVVDGHENQVVLDAVLGDSE